MQATGKPIPNHCGRCTRCIDACPTGALEAPFRIDARKCLSYLTIEYKGSLEGQDRRQFHDWMYGCDRCQDVCPYNQKFAVACMEPLFRPSEALLGMRKKDWETLDRETFDRLFQHSAVRRAGYEGLWRNITFLRG